GGARQRQPLTRLCVEGACRRTDVRACPGGGGRGRASVLSGLNAGHGAAGGAPSGPVCVLAGAGTGKTRTITHRIAHLIGDGAHSSSEVLAVTFTTRAAGEMRGRLRAC